MSPCRFLMLGLVLTITTLLIWVSYTFYQVKTIAEHFQESDLVLSELFHHVQYYDEALTMSTLVAAYSGDIRWHDRYQEYANRLDRALAEISRIAPDTRKDLAQAQVSKANEFLVNLELKAFELVKAGKLKEAQALVTSQEYEQYKKAYSDGASAFESSVKATLSKGAYDLACLADINQIVMACFFTVIVFLMLGLAKKEMQSQ